MIQELFAAYALFEAIDHKITAITKAWGEEHGVTEADIAAAREELLKRSL